jgi:Protein of unknown function (DUF2817)
VAHSFPANYVEARQLFLKAAHAVGAQMDVCLHPQKGFQGEDMAIDVAWLGERNARKVLVTISATHGVEGLYGSGCQTAWLQQFKSENLPANTAVLVIHALNPYGFSWLRRVNEDNMDINRNHVNFEAGPPANEGYEDIHKWLLPDEWTPASQLNLQQQIMGYLAQKGVRAGTRAVTGGQYRHADGIFYGGTQLCWSNRQLNHLAHKYLQDAQLIAVLDHHTGLGPSGHTELICRHPVDSQALALARQWWGADVTSPASGESASEVIDGNVRMAFVHLCPKATVVAIAMEVGTQAQTQVMASLFADNWLYQKGDPHSAQGAAIRQQVRDAFFVDTPQWREQAMTRAMQIWQDAFKGMSNTAV